MRKGQLADELRTAQHDYVGDSNLSRGIKVGLYYCMHRSIL